MLWNQYKYIGFKIFSCRILIVLYNIIIIIGDIYCKNKWIKHMWNIMSKRYNILPSLTNFFISSAEKLKGCRNSKLNFSSSCFIANDSHTTIVCLHVVVFSEYDILNFRDNVYFFKYYPVKVARNCFNSFICSNQTCAQVSKVSLALHKWKKTDLKFL